MLSNEMAVIFNINNEIYKYDIENKILEKIIDIDIEKNIKLLKISNNDEIIAFINNDKDLFVYDIKEKKSIFKSNVINIDGSKIFFSNKNKNILIYSTEGIEIYDLENNTLINYIQDETLKLCYDLKLLDSISTLLVIKNDFNIYKYNYKDIEITKTNINNSLFIEYNELDNNFITINLNKEIVIYDSNFNFISKSKAIISKNEDIKDFFINIYLNKLFIFGSKIWIFDYSKLEILNTIDANITVI